MAALDLFMCRIYCDCRPAHLHVSLEQSLHELVGGVLPQSSGEVLQLVEESVQILPQLHRSTTDSVKERLGFESHETAGASAHLPRLHRDPRLLLHLIDLLPDLRQLRPNTLQILQLLQSHLMNNTARVNKSRARKTARWRPGAIVLSSRGFCRSV